MSISCHSRGAIRGAVLAGLACSSTALAGNETSSDDPTVVVTASRIEESVADTLWSTTVFTRDDIEARQPASVQDLLAGIAGVDVTNNGGLGKLSSVFIRGAESNHTLLLIDGVRVAQAGAGMAPFELIPVSQIERIEVVRGPRSTLYGTDAIGGVVQIFTRRPAQNGLTGDVAVGGGKHDTRQASASLQARGERAWVSIGGESFDTNGFNSCATEAGVVFAGCFASEPDIDGYRSNSGSLAAGYSFNDGWQAQVRSLVSDGRSEFDGSIFSGNEMEFSERIYSLSLDGALSGDWHTRIELGRNEDHRRNVFHDITGTAPVGFFDTDRNTASVQLDGKLSEAFRLIAGADYQRDKVDSDPAYDADSRDTKGVFTELHGRLNAWSGLAGVRYEDDEQFGNHVTGTVGVGRALTDRVRLTATWGTAFHAPTFDDLYYPGFNNPNLDPEKSRSFDVGLSGRAAALPIDWSLHVFQSDIDDLIGYDSGFNLVNIDESRIRGAELEGSWRNEHWKVGGQITRLDPVNRTADDRLLPRRSKESAALEVQRKWSSLSFGAMARYQGRRFDDVANLRPLGGYMTVDLAATQSIGKAFEIQARVANLFDRDYATAAYYLQDGINYNVTLRYRFAAER